MKIKKRLLSLALSGVMVLGLMPGMTMTALADGDTSYTLTIPSTLTVANSGWNATDGISATGTLASNSKLTVTASSANSWALKSGDNTVGYTLTTAEGGSQTTSWEFTTLDGAAQPMGIIVEDYSSKPAGTYQDTVTFTAKVESAAAAPTLTLGEMTQGGDPLNNGSGSETYYSPTFSEGQQIALVHGGVKDVVTVGTPNPDGSAPITGDITVGADNEDIVLVYPADLVALAAGGTAYTENTDVTNKFKTQAGTLAYIQNNLDIRQGTGKLAVSGASASLKANVSMASQIAIWKLTMTGGGGMIMAQKVTVKVGGNKVAEASTSGTYFAYPIDIYLALNPATMGTGTLRIEADEFGTIYYYQKDGGVSLTAGKFYQSAVELKR